MSGELPDVEGALRTYFRAWPPLTGLVAQRIYLSLPRDNVVYPCLDLFRVGGGDDPSEAPVDRALIQINCWGELYANGNGNKTQAAQVAFAVRSGLNALRGRVDVGTVALMGSTVESVIWLLDPADARPRYAVTTLVTAMTP